jgi:hypothetical protein
VQRELKSGFYPILDTLVREVQGARAAIFSDGEGESIEFCGDMDPYDIKVIGAYTAVILDLLSGRPDTAPELVVISCRRLTLCLRRVESYSLTLVLRRRTFAAGMDDAIERAVRKFIIESGMETA